MLNLSDADTKQIHNIILRGDIVTLTQEYVFLMSLDGYNFYIGPHQKKYSIIEQFNKHFIKNVINYLKK